jgi:outer membrane lipoprotein-sorting protein
MKNTRLLSVSLLILVASECWSQDFRQAMEQLQKKYQNAENFRIRMSVDVFGAKGNERSFYRDKITITKRGTSFRHHLSGMDMVMNDKYIVVVDHSSKKIIINKRDVKGEAKFYKQVRFNMDSMLQFYEDARLETTLNNINKFSATQKIGPIGKVEFFIAKGSTDLKQINYSYRAGQWATIIFDEFELSPTFNMNEFDEQQFVRKTGKSWQPANTLAGYKVVKADDSNALANN